MDWYAGEKHLYEAGASIIEVLVSLVLMSLLLLHMDAVGIVTARASKATYFYSVASQQLLNMAERVQSLQGASLLSEISRWNQQNSDLLPQGKGVVIGRYPDVVVEVRWGLHKNESCIENKMGEAGCVRWRHSD